MNFIHLRVHSAYSLAEGAVKIKDLIKICQKNKMPAVAVTDTVNLFGALEFSTAAADSGIQPICGALLRITREGSSQTASIPMDELLVIVQTEVGYRNLLHLISISYLEIASGQDPQIQLQKLIDHNAGLLLFTGSPKSAVGRLLYEEQHDQAIAELRQLKDVFGDRLYLELMRHGLEEEEKIEGDLLKFADEFEIPLVATNDVYFPTEDMYEAHDALLCISASTFVSEINRRRLTPHHYFKTATQMADLFSDIPEAIENTCLIAQRCSYRPLPHKPILPAFPCSSGRTEAEELCYKAEVGLEARLEAQVYLASDSEDDKKTKRDIYYKRLAHELSIIETMGFPGYFLIVSDFIQWAKGQLIPVGPGRGSGAGSLVAWSLTITDIDPIRFSLLFERFLNPERVSMPDFDIDFCQDRRDEVIRYVCQKYGDDRVAQIITFGKLQARAVLRDVGRVLQMPYSQVDRISKLIPNNPANPTTLEQALVIEPALEDARKADIAVAKLIDMGMKLEGLYRHASTHAAGVVIGDRPLSELVAVYKDERSELPATQFSMKYVEMAGLVKFDFLGLKTLTVIQKCCDLVRQNGIDINISQIPLDDPITFELLGRVETVGIFQVESAGMRDVMKKLRPDRFEDLIALVALYRPGPMDDIPRYLACKHGQEEVTYLHPDLVPILEGTYGVMVYQEQVMQIAQVLGGYTLGAADLLRRAMGKKIKSEMDAQEALFVQGAVERGVDRAIASQIFEQMAKFAGYGFNKSHSAPYALLTYQTAYLKANYPKEFYAASMTYEMQNTDKLNVFRQDIERAEIPLYQPDVNKSDAEFVVENDGVRYALSAVKNVGEQAMKLLASERAQNGEFTDIFDFISRVDGKVINKRLLENLISAGAFDCLSDNRAQLYTSIEFLLKQAQLIQAEKKTQQASLFGAATTKMTHHKSGLPPTDPWSTLEKLQKEFDALGFYLSSHPLNIYGDALGRLSILKSTEIGESKDGSNVRLAGVLLVKQERTSKTGQKFAFLQISDPYGVFEVAVFSEVFAKNRDLLIPGTAFSITAMVRVEGDNFRLIAQSIDILDTVIQSSTANLTLYAEPALNVNHLKRILQNASEGKTVIKIDLKLTDSVYVSIRNIKSCHMDQGLRAQLLSVPGILKMSG
ncbi:DNA polymerase III subunit alpha [Candidatus Paracaedibacter symbiosus]|uniref:DNA polymerase III subunit alpha n=1 Tax=Candidatus Paracaedibacter symbiosus TaxID=244582 RepID=UPI000509761C|nr:DNA polymerase III subunit alpha [Candidatus Paracaedibacter symbiosus]